MAMGIPRLSPAVYLMGSIVIMALLDRLIPVVDLIQWPWNLAGLAAVSVGGLLMWRSLSALSQHNTAAEPFHVATALVTSGAYRFSRNPMYLGATLVLLGIAVALGTLTPFLVLPVYLRVMQMRVIQQEEKAMLSRFGESYSQYQASVRRWL